MQNKVNRTERISEQIMHLAAEFFSLESNRKSMITVTRANVSPDMSNSTIFFTVIPDKYEIEALHFAKRKRSAFKKFVKQHTKLRKVPFFDFELDMGEKHRQHIDELSRQLKD